MALSPFYLGFGINPFLSLHSRVILYAQVKEPQMPEKASPAF